MFNIIGLFEILATPATSLTTDVKGVIGGVTLPWYVCSIYISIQQICRRIYKICWYAIYGRPGDFPPVCENDLLVGSCPVAVGENMTVGTVLVLSSAFPSVSSPLGKMG